MATTQGIKLEDETRARLAALATIKDRSPHWIMKTAIEQYLDNEEAYEREKAEDMARWERYLQTGKAIDYDVVDAWLNDLASGKRTECPE